MTYRTFKESGWLAGVITGACRNLRFGAALLMLGENISCYSVGKRMSGFTITIPQSGKGVLSQQGEYILLMIWRYRQAPPLDDMNRWIEELGFLSLFSAGLWSRGFGDQAGLERFFRPRPDNLLNPAMFGDEMERAVARLRSAFENKEKIVVFGDYDVDGTSGAALIQDVLLRLAGHYGFCSEVMLSDRFTEGYGLNAKNLDRLIALRPKLVVTVDCGVSSGVEIAQL